jgi:hypothetical protein
MKRSMSNSSQYSYEISQRKEGKANDITVNKTLEFEYLTRKTYTYQLPETVILKKLIAAYLIKKFPAFSSSLARQPCVGPGLLRKLLPFFPIFAKFFSSSLLKASYLGPHYPPPPPI